MQAYKKKINQFSQVDPNLSLLGLGFVWLPSQFRVSSSSIWIEPEKSFNQVESEGLENQLNFFTSLYIYVFLHKIFSLMRSWKATLWDDWWY